MSDQKTISTLLQTGVNLLKSKRYHEALSIYDSVLVLDPRNDVAWAGNALSLHHLERYPQALAAYDQALAINPNNADVWNWKGVMLFQLNRYEEAIAAFDRALSINPNGTNFKNNRDEALKKVDAIKHREKYGLPIKSAPILFTLWGTGGKMWGDTYYFTIFWIPVLPIGRYSIEPHPFYEQLPFVRGEYKFYGKLELHPWQKTWQFLLIGLISGVVIAIFLYH